MINPDEIIAQYGADTMRLYEMFIGDFEKAAPWSSTSIRGCKRFVERFAGLTDLVKGKGVTPELEKNFHKAIRKVTMDIEEMKFNTAIATMMSLINEIYEVKSLTKDELNIFTRLLCPFAPHICEEMWEYLGEEGFASLSKWPEYDESKTVDNQVEIAVQICGKLRGRLIVSADAEQSEVMKKFFATPALAAHAKGKRIVKEIYVKNKLLNVVIR